MVEKPDGRFLRRPSLLVFLAALLLLPLLFWPLFPVLAVSNPRTGDKLWVRIISPGQTFCLSYLHSVELSLVEDCFTASPEGKLILFETRFDSSNTGLPTHLAEGEKLILDPDGIRIINRRIALASLQLWVHEKSLNRLTMNSISLALPALAGNLQVELSVVKLSPLGYVRGRLF
jgi:hypothetical protein